MNRSEMIDEVYERLSKEHKKVVTKKATNEIVQLTIKVLKDALVKGEIVTLREFGTFRVYFYSGRPSWSHTKGRMVDSRPYMRVVLTMSETFKEAGRRLLEKQETID